MHSNVIYQLRKYTFVDLCSDGLKMKEWKEKKKMEEWDLNPYLPKTGIFQVYANVHSFFFIRLKKNSTYEDETQHKNVFMYYSYG